MALNVFFLKQDEASFFPSFAFLLIGSFIAFFPFNYFFLSYCFGKEKSCSGVNPNFPVVHPDWIEAKVSKPKPT